LGRTDLYKHKIYTEDVPPIHQKAFRTSIAEDRIIKAEIDKGLEMGLIRPSKSPWASPVVLVKKKNGKTRFCVDYRKLNSITKEDKYPLPLIDEIIDYLGGSQWFSTMDLASGYWQVEIDEPDKEKTAFITKYGLYEYNVMPFGLYNALATFQRLMNTVLEGTIWKYTMDYIDDINVYSKTWEDHLKHLRDVLERLRKAKLKINAEKCHFCTQEAHFLGHVVGTHGVAPDPEKIEKVDKYPAPKCLREVRSFLGLAGYYRKFIKDYSKKAKPLTNLTQKERPFEWTNDQQEAFEELKKSLTSQPVLKYPDFEKEFTLMTDASNIAIGAVLTQRDDQGKEHPIAYHSKGLSGCEKNWDTTNLEAFAVVNAVGKFRHYLHGRKFKIITDHSALLWILNTDKSANPKHIRWRLKLQDYNFEIIHRQGKYNSVPDALSRIDYNGISEESVDDSTPLNEEEPHHPNISHGY
jgi:hypothetical protein